MARKLVSNPLRRLLFEIASRVKDPKLKEVFNRLAKSPATEKFYPRNDAGKCQKEKRPRPRPRTRKRKGKQ